MTDEEMGARIADCLEEHLHEYRWEPYRYPSGEHKGVEFDRRAAIVTLIGADDEVFKVIVQRQIR